MSEHVDEQLEDFALGTLSSAERERVESHLGSCSSCLALLGSFEPAMSPVASALPPPAAPRLRLEAALAGGGRFAHFSAELQRLFDLPAADIERILSRVDDPEAWDDGLAPGVTVMTINAGPKREGYMTALVHLEPGATFPEHDHGAEEEVLVLEGGYIDSSGKEVWRGELDVRQPGDAHSFTAFDDMLCICASVSKPPEH